MKQTEQLRSLTINIIQELTFNTNISDLQNLTNKIFNIKRIHKTLQLSKNHIAFQTRESITIMHLKITKYLLPGQGALDEPLSSVQVSLKGMKTDSHPF